MFDYSLTHWVTFFTAAILLNLSPGPDMAFILSKTVRHGKRSGFVAMAGIWVGACFHVALAAIGLSAILVASAVAFSIVKWIGVMYLVWLGIQAFRSHSDAAMTDVHLDIGHGRSVFKQGILISVFNPKVAIFFLAFLPQFVVDGAGPHSAQLFLHGLLIIAVAGIVEPPLILVGSKLTAQLRNNSRISLWLDRLLGSLFIALGIKLAFTERS